MAALSGMAAGAVSGCNQGGGDAPAPSGSSDAPATPESKPAGDEATAKVDPSLMLEEPHVCRGLNTCKGKGASGDNACAGQGTCATAEKHTCHYENACKGQGGCGSTAGRNSCKGKGECAVPLSDGAWTKAREIFEQLMKDQGKEVGAAPAKR